MGVGEPDRPPRIAIGCFTVIAGFFSGAMIGVLVGKGVGIARKCIPAEGLPVCNWEWFAFPGGAIGAISLTGLVLWRLRRSPQPPEHSERV